MERATADEAWAAARVAWPDVEVEAPVFAAYLEERAGALHATDLYLACACLAGQHEALVAFERAFMAPVDTFVRRYDASPAFVDEVRQILRERFFVWTAGAPPRIASYTGQGALGAWVRVAAVRVALRLVERAQAPLGSPVASDAGDSGAAAGDGELVGGEPELDYIRVRYRDAFAGALAAAIASLPADDRTLLRLHFAEGLTIDRLAPLFDIHRATAARRLAQARERLHAETRSQLETRLGVTGRELDSLLAVVRSRLELDMSGLFR
jgi:RNA polymerase sigma-70 factor (ECF subfamily)|nr:sigma factor-like helix-turn-helix DNA-binding protein [Kofleriaceae bacterium]